MSIERSDHLYRNPALDDLVFRTAPTAPRVGADGVINCEFTSFLISKTAWT